MAADDVPFAADDFAGMKVLDVAADLDDSADELMADGHGDGNRFLGPGVPLVDMHVGPADAGAENFDQHVARADFGERHVVQPQPRFSMFLN